MAIAIFKRLLADLETQEREETLDEKSRTVMHDIKELLADSKPPLPPDIRPLG